MGGSPLSARTSAPIIDVVATEPIRILLEVHLVGDSLHGRASTDSDPAHEFAGWIGLLKVLEELLPDPRSASEAEESR